jgi:hypothetical protein
VWRTDFFCLVATELLTNNAAAAITFPLAYSVAQTLGVRYCGSVRLMDLGSIAMEVRFSSANDTWW